MLWQIVLGDIDRGIVKRKKLYLLFAAVAALLCLMAYLNLNSKIRLGQIEGAISIADVYMVFFKGSRILSLNDSSEFYMSEQYLLLSLIIAFMVGNYAVRDMYGYGLQIIIRSRSVAKWWLGKVIWCFISNIIIHLVIFFSMTVISLCSHYSFEISLNRTLLATFGYPQAVGGITAQEAAVMIFVLPFMATFALCMLQMLLSVVFSPIVSLVVLMAEMAACLYSGMGIFLSNGLMFVRNDIFCADGTNNMQMLIAQTLTIALTVLAGIIYMKKTDMLSQKEK